MDMSGLLYTQLQQWFPAAFWKGRTDTRTIALTFDDGPHPESTPALVELLERLQIRATFFHVGKRAEQYPALVQLVAQHGHQIGLHGYEHQSFLLKGAEALIQELTQAQTVVAQATGRPPAAHRSVRPPFGHFTANTLRDLGKGDFQPVMWTLVPFHWLQSKQATLKQVAAEIGSGDILVLHENLPGPTPQELAAEILPPLLAAGYQFVTVDELRHGLAVQPQP